MDCLQALGVSVARCRTQGSQLPYYERSLELAVELGESNKRIILLSNIAVVYQKLGRFPEAVAVIEEALPIVREAGVARTEGILLGNLGKSGRPHALARELIGTSLASELGLPTFDYALIWVDDEDCELAQEIGAEFVRAGPAFISRYEVGATWDGTSGVLDTLQNIDAISRFVVLDTWIRNRDRCLPAEGRRARCNYDNVWLSLEGADETVLKANDHTHCLDQGSEITSRLSQIDRVKDERVYGLFPAFQDHLDGDVVNDALRCALEATSRLEQILAKVPKAWEMSPALLQATRDFLRRRAHYLKKKLPVMLASRPGELDLDGGPIE